MDGVCLKPIPTIQKFKDVKCECQKIDATGNVGAIKLTNYPRFKANEFGTDS